MGVFFAHWLLVLAIAIVGSVLGYVRRVNSATLLLGVGAADIIRRGDDSKFAEFCRHGPVTPLREADTVVVQASGPVGASPSSRLVYSKRPLLTLARWAASASFFKEHFGVLFVYFCGVLRQPILCLLARDFSYHALFSSLNRKRLLKAVVVTNSNYLGQPLWMTDLPGRKFDVHMVWYSTNTRPLVYASDPVQAETPSYRLMRIDQFWIWTEAQRKWLQSIGQEGIYHIVGPILWYLPHYELKPAPRGLRVCLFDVTPVQPAIAASMGLAGVYYSPATMIKFIDDIMEITEEIQHHVGESIETLLKSKRIYEPIHDSSYTSLVQRYARETGRPALVEPATDLYDLIANCDLVLAIPYSSPAYIATALGVPSVFYDPTGELLPTYDHVDSIQYAANRESLKKIMLDTLTAQRDHHRSNSVGSIFTS